VALSVIGLVQAENLALNCPIYIARDACSDGLFEGFAPPIGKDVLSQLADLLWLDRESILRASGQHLELSVHPIHRAFWGDDPRPRPQGTIPYEELLGINRDAQIADKVQEHFGSADGHWLALRLPVALGDVTGALYVNLALVLQQPLPDASYPPGGSSALPSMQWES
jgi:hypothetical protein